MQANGRGSGHVQRFLATGLDYSNFLVHPGHQFRRHALTFVPKYPSAVAGQLTLLKQVMQIRAFVYIGSKQRHLQCLQKV